MSPPKVMKKTSQFFECDTCKIVITQKDVQQHLTACPFSFSNVLYNFIYNNCLYGYLEKSDKESETSVLNNEFVVFLSEPVIQLCNLTIGDWSVLSFLNDTIPPLAKLVWPTSDKTLTSITLTKKGLDLFPKKDSLLKLSKLADDIKEAKEIILIPLVTHKSNTSAELLNRIHHTYLDKVLTYGNKISILFFGKQLLFEVKEILSFDEAAQSNISDVNEQFCRMNIRQDSYKFYKVCKKTFWKIFSTEEEYLKEKSPKNSLHNIGGLDKEITEITELMNIALGKSNYISGLQIVRSVLLFGSSGNGKTLLANALAKNSGAHIININLIEIYSEKDLSPEEKVTSLYLEATNLIPTVILIDDIDTLCPAKSSKLTESEKRISASIFKMFEELCENQHLKIFLISTTNKLDSVDKSLRRSGRLDKEIEIPIPNSMGRFDIVRKILKNSCSCTDNELKEVTENAHGFVGSDLEALCATAALNAVRNGGSQVSLSDLKHALVKTVPSAMREVQVEVPNVRWSDIGGQQNLKLVLKQAVEWPLKHPEVFVRMGISPPKGVLMYGPPGCSKTMIAKALATESNLNFLSIKGPELFSKWVGESERAVREVFRKARQVAPSVIFFDEIDAIGGERASGSSTTVQERVLAQLLTELDGVTPLEDVTVLAATNRPDRIDKALLRPGRLDRIVYVPLPDKDTRTEIFQLKFSKMPIQDINLDYLVQTTEGYSGAEVNAICHEAALLALEQDMQAKIIEMQHFLKALEIIRPRTPQSLLDIYTSFK